jgi:integrase
VRGHFPTEQPPSRRLIDELDRLALQRGYPRVLRCDNGPELACEAMADWADGRVGLSFVPPGQPWRNGCVESFDGRVRDECLNINSASLVELEVLTAAMPERYRPMVMLSSWCGLRFGEVTELRRKDLDLTNGVIHVRRGVVRAGGETVVGSPKSTAGIRDVAIPPHLVPMLRAHRDAMPVRGVDGLLFPAADGTSHLAPSTLYRHFYAARMAAGRPDLRWHDLRHTGAVLAASTGATLAELMARLGHSTPGAALGYQHAAQGRDAQIAAALSKLAQGLDSSTV